MAKHILQPREGVMFSGVAANVTQKSTDATNYGYALEFSQYNCVAFQAWWNGIDGTGKFQLQTSVKAFPAETDWIDKIGAAIETVGATGTDINVTANIGEKTIRVVWIPDGDVSTGTISADLMAKDSSGPANFTKEDPLNVTSSFTGLRKGGLITEVQLSSTEWRALPANALAERNAISIQNISGLDIKINYVDTEAGYVGVQISSGIERFYDITDSIKIYAKAASGTPTIVIEELS